jgi:outer membrane protein TolC
VVKSQVAVGLSLAGLIFMAGCGERQTTKATTERLDGLLASGIDGEDRTRAEERLQKTLNKENATGALADNFGSAAGSEGAVTLDQLLASTLERNSDIGIAAQAINRADAERMNAIYGYLPQVSVSYTYTNVDQEVVETDNVVFEEGRAKYPVTNLGVEIRQPIFDLSRIYGIQLQNTARSVAEVEYIAAVHAAAYETYDAYFVAVQSKARGKALTAKMQLVSRQISVESAMVSEGLSTDITGRTYAAELASLAADEAVEASRYADALSKLSMVSGLVVSDVSDASLGRLGRGNELSPEAAIAKAEESNPALLGSAITVVATELGRRQALAADFAPVIDAFALYEDETREGSRFGGGSRTVDTTVGVRLTLPIFNAEGQGYASTLETVDLRDAALRYYGDKRQLETEILSTIRRLQELSTAIGQSSRALSAITANVGDEQARVETGESVDLVVLSRKLAQVSARERLEFQQIEYLRAWGLLQYLTGEDLRELARQ